MVPVFINSFVSKNNSQIFHMYSYEDKLYVLIAVLNLIYILFVGKFLI
jgi:hypothetical protein